MDFESLSTDLKEFTEKAGRKLAEQDARFLGLEQKFTAPQGFAAYNDENETPGAALINSDGFKAFLRGAPSSGFIEFKTALINALGQNQPLVPSQRTGLVRPAQRNLRLRDVLPSSPTSSNSIELVKETAYTNNAGPQYSGGAYENVVKPESAFTFSLTPVPVSTLAHWIPVSNQLLDDSVALQGYINSRLMYGLKVKEEDELLNGSGIQGHLSGLVTNATAYDTNFSNVTTDSYLDTVRNAALQLQVLDYSPTTIVLNPYDWSAILGTKEEGTGISSGAYVFANPQVQTRPELWGLNVVVTNSMARSQFLCFDADAAAMIWDRQTANITISREHSDYFTRNMSAILVEERLALTVLRSDSLVFGGFPFGS